MSFLFFLGGGLLPRCWVNVEPRAPGGYLSPRGSECSPVGIPPPLQGEAEGIWIGGPTWTLWGPVGPLPAKTLENGEDSEGLTCLFVYLAEEQTVWLRGDF